MHLTRGRIFFLVAVAAAYYGWGSLSRSANETVILEIPGVRNQDTFTILWVVEDPRHVWIRAENPRRLWLDYLRDAPVIELHRHGRKTQYRATLYDTEDARDYVDPMFRAKYGLADEVRAVVTQRETVPIRLARP